MLALAWIPFLLAVALYDSDRRKRTPALLLTLGAAWLVFLPNAPYIVTDFIHIGEFQRAPLWYDAGMTAAFAGTGLVLGLASILLVQNVVARRFGALVGWAMLAPIFLLCSAGIYIGRVHRLNSWDVNARPQQLLDLVAARLADRFGRPEMLFALAGLTGFLAIAYLVLYTISDLGPGARGARVGRFRSRSSRFTAEYAECDVRGRRATKFSLGSGRRRRSSFKSPPGPPFRARSAGRRPRRAG